MRRVRIHTSSYEIVFSLAALSYVKSRGLKCNCGDVGKCGVAGSWIMALYILILAIIPGGKGIRDMRLLLLMVLNYYLSNHFTKLVSI